MLPYMPTILHPLTGDWKGGCNSMVVTVIVAVIITANNVVDINAIQVDRVVQYSVQSRLIR